MGLCWLSSVVAERTKGLCAIKTRFSAKTAPPVKGKNGLDGAARPYLDTIRRWRFLLSNMAMDAKRDPGLWLLGSESREILTRWCDHNLAGEENGGEKHWGALSPAELALALRAGHLTTGSLQNRKNRVKWIFDKFWHGGNAAKGRTRADDTEAICVLYGDDGDGVFHIVHGCDHASGLPDDR